MGSPAWCRKQGRVVASSPELNTPAASALGDGVGVVDGVREATSQPVECLPAAAGAHGGDGGSPEELRRHGATDAAPEAVILTTNCVHACVVSKQT
jgi:hypothetical protein